MRSIPLLLLPVPLLSCGSGEVTEPENVPPICSIITPARHSVFPEGSEIEIRVEASDPDGAIELVVLDVDGEELAVLSDTPYVFTWTPDRSHLGNRMVRARAIDDAHAITGATHEIAVSHVYRVPTQDDDGLEVGHASQVGINEVYLSALIDRIATEYYQNVHAILIYRSGKLVFEEYMPGERYLYSTTEEVITEYTEFDRFTRHRLSSTTKSFTTALLGIAIDRGYIGSEEDYIIDYLPEYAHLLTDGKEEIKIKHLAGMCAGLQWNEGNFPTVLNTESDLLKAFAASDPFEYLLSKPLVTDPGAAFYYNSWLMMTLGRIVRTTSGKLVADFAREYLFEPLGVTDFLWTGGEMAETSGGLYVRPRDLLKFGVLYLNGGNWQGTQIVDADWVSKATAIQFPFDMEQRNGYGFGWWTRTHPLYGDTGPVNSMKAFHGGGWGGQFIFVFPEYELVVAMNAGNYSIPSSQYPNYDMMSRYILPAVVP